MGLGLHNTNRHITINGPAITVSPLQAKLADPRPSCRNAILDAIDRLHQRTGATEFTPATSSHKSEHLASVSHGT